MLPDISKITISNNLEQIKGFISEIIVSPKQNLHKWASITNQTPAAKIGYIGQHLASLITGIPGTGSGARGDDLSDGSEVKSCNKIDQVDKCKECKSRVLRFEEKCPVCGSDKIDRKEDSKWLFSVRDERELKQYLHLNRIFLLLMDYPNFKEHNFNDIRISSYEIYPQDRRMKVFCELIKNHYYKIFLPKLEANDHTNPMNLHPFGFQFYKCNPIKTFSCIVKDIDSDKPKVLIDESDYIKPSTERNDSIPTIPMPTDLIKDSKGEWKAILDKANYEEEIKPLLTVDLNKEQFQRLKEKDKQKALPYLNETLRDYIPLRDIVSVKQTTQYQRK